VGEAKKKSGNFNPDFVHLQTPISEQWQRQEKLNHGASSKGNNMPLRRRTGKYILVCRQHLPARQTEMLALSLKQMDAALIHARYIRLLTAEADRRLIWVSWRVERKRFSFLRLSDRGPRPSRPPFDVVLPPPNTDALESLVRNRR
jgi:hypothetical protein